MVKADSGLGRCSRKTLDTLRTLDLSLCSVNFDLITSLVRHILVTGQGSGNVDGAVLVFMPGVMEIVALLAARGRRVAHSRACARAPADRDEV